MTNLCGKFHDMNCLNLVIGLVVSESKVMFSKKKGFHHEFRPKLPNSVTEYFLQTRIWAIQLANFINCLN